MKKILSYLFLLTALLTFLQADYVKQDEALTLLKSKNSKDYPISDNLYLKNTINTINEDGSGTSLIENYKKILTNKSRKNNKLYFFFNSNYGKVNVKEIVVIKRDGEKISFDPKKILTEKDNSFSTGSNIYSKTSRILTGELPNLEISDIIYTKEIETTTKSSMKGEYFDEFDIESYSPYLNKFLSITMPRNKKLYIHNLNDHGYKYKTTTKTSNNKTTYTFNVKNPSLIVDEPHMEKDNFVVHQLKLTTVKDWQTISRWYYNLVAPHLEKTNQDIKDKVKELTKDCKTKKEKIGNIFYWVAQKIRYLGVDKEKNRPGLEPHDVDYTFSTRGGVCRDKAALLTAMLRIAGIDSDVILISLGNRLNKEAPMAWFNHAITVSYDKSNKPEYILDPTSETTKDFLPKYDEDCTYIIASKDGSDLDITPISKPKENNSTIDIDLTLDKDNDAFGLFTFSFKGLSDTVLRGWFSSATEYEMKQAVQNFLTKFHPNIELQSFKTVDPKNRTKDMKIQAEVKIVDFAQKIQDKIIIPFGATKLNMNFMYNYMLSAFNLSQRKYDFSLPGSFSFDINLKLKSYKQLADLSITKPENLNYKGFKTKLISKIDKNTLLVTYHFEASKIHFKQEEYAKIKNKLSNLDKAQNLYMIGKIGVKDAE